MQPQSSTPVPSKRYYVYTLARPDGRVFYVGKGTARKKVTQRVDDHEIDARSGCECYKCRVIRKVWATGAAILKAVIFETDDEIAALTEERRVIATFEPGVLANSTSGGDGIVGVLFSEEHRHKLSDAAKLRIPYERTEEHRLKMVEATRGIPKSEDQKRKLSEAKRGKPRSAEATRKIVAALRGRHLPPERIAQLVAFNTGRRQSEETRRRMSEAKRDKPFTEKQLAAVRRNAAARIGQKATDEHRRHISEALKKYWEEKKNKDL